VTSDPLPTTGSSGVVASANLTIKFLLELAALALLAYWGAVTGDGIVAVVLAVIAPLSMVAVWGTFAAPRAPRRAPTSLRIPLELGIFAEACVAGYAGGAFVASTVFAVVVVLNAIGLTVLHQWTD
jgi:hypothetical protein